MHESGVVKALLRRVEGTALLQGPGRITVVKLRLGAFCPLSPAHLRDQFAHGAAGTVAEGAHLDIEVSEDPADPLAQDIVLESVELEAT